MGNWKLPDSLVQVIGNHLELRDGDDYELESSIVHLAALFGDAFSNNLALDDLLAHANRRVWDTTGLDTGRCEEVDQAVAEQLNAVVNMLFPKLQKQAI